MSGVNVQECGAGGCDPRWCSDAHGDRASKAATSASRCCGAQLRSGPDQDATASPVTPNAIPEPPYIYVYVCNIYIERHACIYSADRTETSRFVAAKLRHEQAVLFPLRSGAFHISGGNVRRDGGICA